MWLLHAECEVITGLGDPHAWIHATFQLIVCMRHGDSGTVHVATRVVVMACACACEASKKLPAVSC